MARPNDAPESPSEREERISERLAAKLAEPVRDRSDELLDAPPAGEHHLGRLAGYRAGRKVRVRLGIVMGAAAVVIAFVSITYQLKMHKEAEAAEYKRLHPWSLPEGTDASDRSRTITWSTGKARLALSADPPGANRIELPDRIIELAEGHDHAQVRFEIVDGETVAFQVLSGNIVMRKPDGSTAAPVQNK